MSGVTQNGIRYPDGASKAKNLGPELQTMAEDIDRFIDTQIDSESPLFVAKVKEAAGPAVAAEVASLPVVRTDVLDENLALNPNGVSPGWISDNPTLYTVAAGADEAVVTRSSTGPLNFRAILRSIGMLGQSNVWAKGVHTISVEVFTDTPTRVVAYGAFPAQRIPANSWTRVYGSFSGTGAAQVGPTIAIAEAIGASTAGAVTRMRGVSITPGTPRRPAGNGAVDGWQFDGPSNAAKSSGLAITSDVLDVETRGLRGGVRIVPLGDSTTIANSSTLPSWGGRDFWAWAHILSGGRFKLVRNAGIAGNKTVDMIERFHADVTPYHPTVVPIIAGINDSVGRVPEWLYRARIRRLVGLVREIGATPWLGNIAPNLNVGAIQQTIASNNAWLKEYAASEGIPLIDVNGALTDPATGKFLPEYDLDGTHQNVAGAKAVARAILEAAEKNLPDWSPNLPTSNTPDQLNLLTNGLFLDGATGWTVAGGVYTSQETPDVKGRWARLTDNGAGTATLTQIVPASKFTSGDVLNFVGRIRQINGTSKTTTRLFARFDGINVTHEILWQNTEDVEDGAFSIDIRVPVGATSLTIELARNCTTPGTGYTQLAQLAVFNQTRMGATDRGSDARNHAMNPNGDVVGWVSENTGLYQVAPGQREVSVTRLNAGTFDFRAVLRTIGMLGEPNVWQTGPHVVSVEVFTNTPARVVAYGAFPAQTIPANTWTRVYGSFNGTGAAQTGPAIAIAETAGVTTAGAVTRFRRAIIAPGIIHPEIDQE